ncbi:MAG: energy transducer TonB [Verrucomicrobia subdivision 3 bacterium]|nr:energy transducer TonB [Limisphaerales bacterium]
MNAPAYDLVRWSVRKWLSVIGILFLGQTILILILGERQRPPVSPVPFVTGIQVAADPLPAAKVQQWPDAAEFALPTLTGFSRDAWLSFQRPEFRLSDWTEPPQWLALNPAELGLTLGKLIGTNESLWLRLADQPLPRALRHETPAGNPPSLTQSELWVQGELAAWTLDYPIELPSWPHTELLSNTVVQTVVDASGYAIGASVLAKCGLAEADQLAERIVREARFRPPPARGRRSEPDLIASGKLVFKWHTVPGTNTLLAP